MKNKDINKTLLISASIFIISLALLIIISTLTNTSLESLSATVAAAAVFGAAYFAYQELSEAANTRYMDISDRLFADLNSPENIEARRRIFQNLHEDPETGLEQLEKEDHDAMNSVLNSLDHVAFLTQQGWIPDDLIMPWMHPMIAKSWKKLEPYVLYERARREEPYYYQHAGELAKRCNEWREENLTEAERTNKWVKKAL